MRNKETKALVFTAILVAFGILITMEKPIKVIIGPASFTLASHVPVFLAMFISPLVAILVALGTSFGFLMAGFPIVIVMRAVSHFIFALLGSLWIKKHPNDFKKPLRAVSSVCVTFIFRRAVQISLKAIMRDIDNEIPLIMIEINSIDITILTPFNNLN